MTRYQSRVPLAWYFNQPTEPALQRVLTESQYIGSTAMVPTVGSYAALPHSTYEHLLVQNDEGFVRLSNRCRHKRSLIIDPLYRRDPPRGTLGSQKRLVCPVHCWAYDLAGRNVAQPYFDMPGTTENSTQFDLPAEPLSEWHGYLFGAGQSRAADLAQLGSRGGFDPQRLDLRDYVFVDWEVQEYNFNWLVFMDVYFDLYHVAPYHKRTFNQLVDTTAMIWEFGESYSVQITNYRSSTGSISTAYEKLRSLIQELWRQTPPHGALWAAFYPNVMVEWYPLMLVVSTIQPLGPKRCRNVVEYYIPRQWQARQTEILAAQRAAYNETAVEDAEICLTMSDGYYADYCQGVDERGPDHPHLEEGIIKFHNWLQRGDG